jgi:putative adenylate-forming enzyme
MAGNRRGSGRVFVKALRDKILLASAIAALSRRDRWSRDRLVRHQADRLSRLRRHALGRSKFYRRFHEGLEEAPLDRLPILTKESLMSEFDEIVTEPGLDLGKARSFAETMSAQDLLGGRFHIVATSGTTGARGIFAFSGREWRILAMASVARGMGWSNRNARPGERGVVMTSTIPWHMTARASAELRRLGLSGGRLGLDAGAPVDALVSALNEYQPKVMMVYPSIMQILADEQDSGRLRIAPEHIQCTSEVLTGDARDAIERAFGVTPANLYAASECGCIAASCEMADGLHISEDLLIVDSVDERGHPVPEGTLGARTLVTVLENRTLPLIRYELSDRIALQRSPCRCGRPYARIADIAGRQGDLLRLPGLSGEAVEIAPAQITACLRGTAIRQWQISVDRDAVRLLCVCAEEAFQPADAAGRLAALFEARGAIPPRISVDRAESVVRGPTGKSRLITTITR